MRKYLPVVVFLLALALVTLACDGDGNGNGDGVTATTPGATPDGTATAGPTEAPTEQPSPTGEETTAAVETPTIEPTVATPAASPIAVGTPAVAPADLSPYEGMAIDQEECLFDPLTALANCLERGLYTVDPPLIGEDISCSILIVQDEAVALLCRSQEPQEAVYYAIQGMP